MVIYIINLKFYGFGKGFKEEGGIGEGGKGGLFHALLNHF